MPHASLPPQPVSAHGKELRLEISLEVLKSSPPLQIRGVGFDTEKEVTLVRAGSRTSAALDTIPADVEGGFLRAANMRPDLAERTYFVRVSTDGHDVESAVIALEESRTWKREPKTKE